MAGTLFLAGPQFIVTLYFSVACPVL